MNGSQDDHGRGAPTDRTAGAPGTGADSTGLSRRDLIKGIALGAAGLAAGPALIAAGEGVAEAAPRSLAMGMGRAPKARIRHFELYATDGYINRSSGAWPPPAGDAADVPGWPAPVYIWGFTDIDPNNTNNVAARIAATTVAEPWFDGEHLFTVPPGAQTTAGGRVGNAKFPAPYLEVQQNDEVYITVHNRGMYQDKQGVQDDHSLHLHGIHAQAQYDGLPESAGSYTENTRYFWQEPWYLAFGSTPRERDAHWNSLTASQQRVLLSANAPLRKTNKLNTGGGITNQLNTDPAEGGVGGLTVQEREDVSQYTYFFKAMHAGTYMYHCHVAAAEHVQMGMYGALVIRPRVDKPQNTVYGGLGKRDEKGYYIDQFDKEYTFVVSEFDTDWHIANEVMGSFDPPEWKPQLWFINGRTFPNMLLPFKYDATSALQEAEPRYDTAIKVAGGQRFLIRWINMGYQEHSMHQHGWHMTVLGADARPFPATIDAANAPHGYSHQGPGMGMGRAALQKYTLLIGSGETYDTITVADPVYGANGMAGGPASSPMSDPKAAWRQVYVIHDHNDYMVTTNGNYPGGGLIVMEATGVVNPSVPPANTPTWGNPYNDGAIQPVP